MRKLIETLGLRPWVYGVARARGTTRVELAQDWTADLFAAWRGWAFEGRRWSPPTRRWSEKGPRWPLPTPGWVAMVAETRARCAAWLADLPPIPAEIIDEDDHKSEER